MSDPPLAPQAQAEYDQLLALHQESVKRLCRAVLRDEHRGGDAAQEVFVRLLGAFRKGASVQDWGAWLRKVAVRCAVDHGRREQARPDRAEISAETRSALPGPVEKASLDELRAALDSALHRLPEGQRTVFVLRHSAGLSLREVAETLDLALPTVKTHFARACLKLQRALDAHRLNASEEAP